MDWLWLMEHLKRKHPTLIAITVSTTDDPDSDLQNIVTIDNFSNVQSPSTSTHNIIQNQSLTLPPAKRSRQLKLFGSTKHTELTITEKNNIDKSLVKMITADYQPLSIVENVGFLEYTKKLQPLYTPPSRKLLTTKLLPDQYNIIVSKLKSMLNNVNDVSITTDMWTSDSTKSYITVTCHFIYNDNLYSPVIATREVCESHTGENIASALSYIFNEWNITDKIVTIVSDSGANIKNAINEHLKKYHHPCVAHTLNLSVNDAINKNTELLQVLKTCRAIVGHFKHSSSATEKLREFQKQMGLPELKVKQDVSTRWNSCLIMVERLIEIKNPISAAMSSLRRAPNCLTATEWDLIADCAPILKPFEHMTSELSGEKYPTLSLVIPLIRGLQYTVKNIKPDTHAGILLQNTLLDVVARRLGCLEKNSIVAKSTFLDPRLKKTAFGLADNADNTQKWIIEELTSNIYSNNDDENIGNNISETPASPIVTRESLNSLWEHFDSKLSQVRSVSRPDISATLMVRQYLELPHLQRGKNCLDFWKQHKHTFPELYKLQLKYLCIPATSVPSERVFSKAGLLTNTRRNRLFEQ
ncbi:E3 SUMO-protein ligase ZBED1-like [Rhopalosiphum padi]|uniref:E3 SUMO-protein ligase ZBED1-like n=1 Tax=Rhopalosiphum padi TaxID=40932 RepID=UPI00298DF72D|nr:E3 SUMO-protein ligase ZBED1-like [Rhopalosiphum padi]